MGTCHFGFMFMIAAALGPGQTSGGEDDYRAAATGAARELARQLEALQLTWATIGPQDGRGLYGQTDMIQYALVSLRQQLQRKASREDANLAYDALDSKLTQLLDEIQGFEKWDAALRRVAGRVRVAQHDLHFALSGGNDPATRASQVMYRQTLVLLTRTEDLETQVRYVFDLQEPLKQWTGDLKELRGAIAAFQQLQQKKASRADLTKQFGQTDQIWEKLVGRVKALPQNQYVFLQASAAQVDAVFQRLATTVGVKDRRAPLKNPLFQ